MEVILLDVLVGQLAQLAGHHGPHFPGVDKQRLALLPLVSGQEPQGDRDLRGIEQLGRHGHDAVHQIGVDDVLRMSPSPPLWEEREPLASTMPMRPFGARCQIMCWSQAKLALPAGGVPYCQRTSSSSLSCPQSGKVEGRVCHE